MSCNILLISNKGNLLGEHANIAFYYCIKNNLFAIKLTFFFLMVLLQVLMLIYMQNLKPDWFILFRAAYFSQIFYINAF